MDRLRFGVLGAAKIARTRVIPAMQAGERTTVVAIASRDADTARTAAGDLGIDRAYGTYQELLADPEVDAVYIPLPNHLHGPWTLTAAEAGKHVLCEKPMAMHAEEARAMVAACEAAGVVFMEAFMYRVAPQWVRARALVTEGALGDVRAVQTAFSYHNVDPGNIRNVAAYGGGALMDIGCYCIDVPRFLWDAEPDVVVGAVDRDERFDTDVLSSGVLGFPGGRQATFTCSTQAHPYQRVQIVGTEARLEVEIPFNAPSDRPTRLLVWRAGDPAAAPAQVIEVAAADQYTVQGDAFAAAVLDGAALPIPADNGIGVLTVIERLLAA